jgi:hypothetical protein
VKKNAFIIACFGTNRARIPLLEETVNRTAAQPGVKVIYLVESVLPGSRTAMPDTLLAKVRHHRVYGSPVLWQKEALYNAGAELAIAEGADHLIFLDQDIIPDNDEWLPKVEAALATYDWVHCAKKVIYLKQAISREVIESVDKTAVDIRYARDEKYFNGLFWSDVFRWLNRRNEQSFYGGAWAVNRAAWDVYGKWDCSNICGGGDYLHCNRLLKRFDLQKQKTIGNLRAILFDPILRQYAFNDPSWKTGYIRATVYHLWHGSMKRRKYGVRYFALIRPPYLKRRMGRNPKFTSDQVIHPQDLISVNADGLLELCRSHPYHDLILTRMAEYFLERGETTEDEINAYLAEERIPLRCAYRRKFFLGKRGVVLKRLAGDVVP